MAHPDDELDPDELDPPKSGADDAAKPEDSSGQDGGPSDLWRRLQGEGHVADGPAPETRPRRPEERDEEAEADFERWKRGEGEADDSGAASRLRRMIDSPEELDDAFEYKGSTGSAAGSGDDYDSAVADYLHAGLDVSCRNHPDTPSVQQCPECQAFYCQACLVIRRGRMLCRDCAEAVFLATEEDILRAQEEGYEAPEAEVVPEAPPEFQIGGFGLEGAPAHPLKRALGWVFDFVLLRALLLSLVWLLVGFLDFGAPPEVRAVFATDFEGPRLQVLLRQALTLQPLMFWLPAIAVLDFLYYFLMLGFSNRTIGMGWVGCRIVGEWGDFVGFGAVALRTLIFLACLQLPAILLALFTRGFRGPHDIAAGTSVINYSGLKRVDAYESVQIRL